MAAYRLTGALRGCESGDVWIADGVITRTRPPGPVEDVPGVAYPGLVDAHAHTEGIYLANLSLIGMNYSLFTEDEKYQAGALVNATLSLTAMINKEIKINE